MKQTVKSSKKQHEAVQRSITEAVLSSAAIAISIVAIYILLAASVGYDIWRVAQTI